MNVKVEPEYLTILHMGVVEGVTVVTVTCHDYDHYKTLPAVVSHNGIMCGKTGWNSDRNEAYYQSSAHMVRIERRK